MTPSKIITLYADSKLTPYKPKIMHKTAFLLVKLNKKQCSS